MSNNFMTQMEPTYKDLIITIFFIYLNASRIPELGVPVASTAPML